MFACTAMARNLRAVLVMVSETQECKVIERTVARFAIHMRDLSGGAFEGSVEAVAERAASCAFHENCILILGTNWGACHSIGESNKLCACRSRWLVFMQAEVARRRHLLQRYSGSTHT